MFFDYEIISFSNYEKPGWKNVDRQTTSFPFYLVIASRYFSEYITFKQK